MSKKLPLWLPCLFFSILVSSHADVDLVYAIKEKAYEQYENSQPVGPVWWGFGAGAMGDAQLTSVSVTFPGSSGPVVIPGEPGGFDLETPDYATQQELDAAYPNGNISFSITDNESTTDLGPLNLSGDSYPTVPHLTNVVELQGSDYAQDFLLTWDAFTGYSEGDQILLQIFDYSTDEDVLFEFLEATATTFLIPGGTFAPDNYYEIQLVFISQTDGVEFPQSIIGYLTSTSHILSTQTSDTRFSLNKWRARELTGPDTFEETGYRMLSTVVGISRTVSNPVLITPSSEFPANYVPFGPSTYVLAMPFVTKEVLDSTYPTGSYKFLLTEDDVTTTYGPFYLPEDDYPAYPIVLNYTALQDFDVSQAQAIAVDAVPPEVNFIQLLLFDSQGSQVWANSFGPGLPSFEIPANTLSANADYRLVIRYWAPKTGNDRPPTTLGFISSVALSLNSAQGGGDPGIDLAYVLKARNYQQAGPVAPDSPTSWNVNAGISGSMNITGVSLVHPSGTIPLDGSDGEFDLTNDDFASVAELDAAFPDGQYNLIISTADQDQELGPFQITGSAYPVAPHIQNVANLGTHDLGTAFELTWNAFAGADADDTIVLELYDETIDEELLFEFLDPGATSFVIPGNTLSPDRFYTLGLVFINRVDALDSPEIIVGYMSNTEAALSTHTSDTSIVFYKRHLLTQTGTDTFQDNGYAPLAIITGNSRTVTAADLYTPVIWAPINAVPNTSNLFRLAPVFGPKEVMDAEYPSGNYRFGLMEDDNYVEFGPYDLPPDSYPDVGRILDYAGLQNLDPTKDQPINWTQPSENTTGMGIQIRDQQFRLVWSAGLPAETTGIVIPANALSKGANYSLSLQLWANTSGSDNPPAVVGYGTITRIDFQTALYSTEYRSWLSQYFSEAEILDPGLVGENIDYDGDKLSNYFEFKAGLIPTDKNSRLRQEFEFGAVDVLRISPIPTEGSWVIHSTADFANWTIVGPELYQVSEEEIRVDLAAFPANTFFRLVFIDPI